MAPRNEWKTGNENEEANGIVTMRLRHVLKALTLSLIGMPAIVWAEEKPNIVIILTDDKY